MHNSPENLIYFSFIAFNLNASNICIFFQQIGKINRYVTLGLMTTLLIFTISALSTKNLMINIMSIFDLSHIRVETHFVSFFTGPLICLQIFGKGWGTPLVMASHNNFKDNISNLSLAVVLGNVLITTACMFITIVFYGILDSNVDRLYLTFDHPLESVYVGFPAVFGLMRGTRIMLFFLFTMISVSEIFGIIIQLKAMFTSLFDEFDELRVLRKEIIMGVVGFFVFTTTFYCSNVSFENYIII